MRSISNVERTFKTYGRSWIPIASPVMMHKSPMRIWPELAAACHRPPARWSSSTIYAHRLSHRLPPHSFVRGDNPPCRLQYCIERLFLLSVPRSLSSSLPRRPIDNALHWPRDFTARISPQWISSHGDNNMAQASTAIDAATTRTSPLVSEGDGTKGSLDDDTIVAIVSGAHGQGAVSIVRISGMEALDVARRVFRLPSGRAWEPKTHRIYYGNAIDHDGTVLDEVLSLVMMAPKSFTAEDVVEVHTHGGGVCAHRVLHACLSAGARLAKPGEFSMRAFLNGRIDLSQAESISALIGARTVAAADSALAGLSGGLGSEISSIRSECLDILVELDARLDFDEDLPPLDVSEISRRLKDARGRIAAALATARQGQLLQTGLQIALIGRPNAGKSSLMNVLSGTNRSIVTSIAGTTRDVVEAGIVIGGIPVTLLDTAGVRHTTDEVERIGVERSVATANSADIVIMVMDVADGWTNEDDGLMQKFLGKTARDGGRPPAILVMNKSDLVPGRQSSGTRGDTNQEAMDDAGVPQAAREFFSASLKTSTKTLEGMDALRRELLRLSQAPELAPGGISWAVNERQAEALNRAEGSLLRVMQSVVEELPFDFWTIDIREAVLALGEVSGEEITEEILDTIFSRFCIGK